MWLYVTLRYSLVSVVVGKFSAKLWMLWREEIGQKTVYAADEGTDAYIILGSLTGEGRGREERGRERERSVYQQHVIMAICYLEGHSRGEVIYVGTDRISRSACVCGWVCLCVCMGVYVCVWGGCDCGCAYMCVSIGVRLVCVCVCVGKSIIQRQIFLRDRKQLTVEIFYIINRDSVLCIITSLGKHITKEL